MKKCECETCKLSRRIEAARAAKDVPALVACMTEVWGRMEAAETDLARLNSIRDGTWPSCDKQPAETEDERHRRLFGYGLTRAPGGD